MKAIIVLFATALSFSANAHLESHYGKLSYANGEYHCTYTNNGGDKTMKYVSFSMERRAGKERDFVAKERIDAAVAAGETITVGSGLSARFIGQACKFLAK